MPREAFDWAKDEYLNPPQKDWQKKPAEPGAPPQKADVLLLCLFAAFALAFIVSGAVLAKRQMEDERSEAAFSDLKSLIDVQTAGSAGALPAAQNAPSGQDGTDDREKFEQLKALNGDFIGWLKIDGTGVDYPVVYRPAAKDYYLRRDFDGNYNENGVPYLEEDCTFTAEQQSDNLIIYGHNMTSGTMFGPLSGYTKQDFYEKHKVISFDTIYTDAEYEVFAAFSLDAANTDFDYPSMTDLDPEAFAEYVDTAIGQSYLDTGIVPEYGDQIITLSTCEYTHEDGRLLVLARRLDG